ncbi:MAG: hypothetical protein EHM42_08190, partial [Planctomycetaceae bacterium]
MMSHDATRTRMPAVPPLLRFSRAFQIVLLVLSLFGRATTVAAGDDSEETAAERGWKWLTTKPYLPADFDNEVFGQLWTVWPEPLRAKAAAAGAAERRRLAFERYGLVERPGSDGTGPALGYVSDG